MAIDLTDDDISLIREFVGDNDPTDDQLFDMAEQADIKHPLMIARAVLSKRIGTFTQGADSYNIVGVYSESYSSTLSTLEKRIAEIDDLMPPGIDPSGGGSSALGVTYLRRAGRSR
jgi:hypothetical protein